MEFSPTYISGIGIVLVAILNIFGIKVANDEITKIVEGLVTAILGIVIIWRRYGHGGVSVLGSVKTPK